MGSTHFTKVVGKTGLAVGGTEITVADETGALYQAGEKITKTAAQINAIPNGATANPEQEAVADLTGTTAITGTDTVDAAVVLAAIQGAEGKINAILAALRAAGIIAASE